VSLTFWHIPRLIILEKFDMHNPKLITIQSSKLFGRSNISLIKMLKLVDAHNLC
jgi:hypothetical protein